MEQLGTWAAQLKDSAIMEERCGKINPVVLLHVSISNASLSKTAIIKCWFVPLRKG